MRSQAREAGFFIRLQATKNFPPSRYRESGRGVGPPEKFLAISPAPTPATCQVYKILWEK